MEDMYATKAVFDGLADNIQSYRHAINRGEGRVNTELTKDGNNKRNEIEEMAKQRSGSNEYKEILRNNHVRPGAMMLYKEVHDEELAKTLYREEHG